MIRFYGLSLESINNMTCVDFEMLDRSINIIEAQEMLLAISVQSYPNMKKEDAKNLHKKLHRTAYPFAGTNDKIITSTEFAERLGND